MGNGQSNKSRPAHNSGSSTGLLLLSDLVNKQYPFENLVFEGCGVKGFAYIGAVKVLEKIGALSTIKRFSGVGTGAVVACLLAAGFDCCSLQNSLNQHLENLLTYNQCSEEVLLDELLKTFGWNAGHKFINWFGDLLEEKCENADITFQELYERTGKELCVVVMNLNRMREEYFHPKTTPNVIVRRAILMSISIPGIFQPVKFGLDKSLSNYYLDAGVLCNYPIHCFDGWWLSMEPGNRVPYTCQPITDLNSLVRDRFSGFNTHTIGFTLFDDCHCYEMYSVMKRRLDQIKAVVPIPATELGRKYMDCIEKEDQLKQLYKKFPEATKKLNILLEAIKEGDDNLVSILQLVKKLTSKESTFSASDVEALFGIEKDEDKCIELLQKNDGAQKMLSIADIIDIIDRINRYRYSPNKRAPRTEVPSLLSFWSTINGVVHENGKLREDDLKRTIGIYTGHVTNNDVELEESDEVYLFRQGWNCTVAFLRGLNLPPAVNKGMVLDATLNLQELVNECILLNGNS